MANSSISLVNLDMDALQETFKTYLKSQDAFKDYDFDGSNISRILNLLAFNTNMNAFYLNMVGNEMFMDSSKMIESVMSHSKELNYLPRSFRSAVANVDIFIASTDQNKTSIVVPKGTSFTSRSASDTYTFTVPENAIAVKTDGGFILENTEIFEGPYITESFPVNYQVNTRYILQNFNVDTRSVTVTVVEDSGASVITYKQSTTLFGLNASSKIFFIQPSGSNKYEIVFGDGVIGRKPKDNSIVFVEYRVSNGELPNGLRQFSADGTIGGETTIRVSTVTPAYGGAVRESLEEIKYNAPRAFTTQERAVTTEDYETLLKQNFPEINVVSAYGGEDADPPQYGKVFISLDLEELDGLPKSKVDTYKKFLKARSPLSIDPVFVEPEYLYTYINSIVKYNINTTTLSSNDIKLLAISSVLAYNDENLDDFKATLRYSRLSEALDNSHPSNISNETEILALKYIAPRVGVFQNMKFSFNLPLYNYFPQFATTHNVSEDKVVSSSHFIVENGEICTFEDDGKGVLRLVSVSGDTHNVIKTVGTVNYETGVVELTNFKPVNLLGNQIKVYAKPKSSDIYSTTNSILSILEQDINITVEQLKE